MTERVLKRQEQFAVSDRRNERLIGGQGIGATTATPLFATLAGNTPLEPGSPADTIATFAPSVLKSAACSEALGIAITGGDAATVTFTSAVPELDGSETYVFDGATDDGIDAVRCGDGARDRRICNVAKTRPTPPASTRLRH